MMLYAPLVTGLLAYPVSLLTAALLVAAATAAFFAQNAAGLALRDRAAPGMWPWLAAYVGAGLAALAGLTLGLRQWHLLWLAAPGLALFAWQAHQKRATRRQVDRSLANELATAAVLSLGASAAHAAAAGALRPGAVVPWATFAIYFGGTVLYVKMRVDASRLRAASPWGRRWQAGGACLVYHGLLAVLAALAVERTWPAPVAAWLAAGYAPAVLRAAFAWARLGGGAPPLRRIGLGEVGYAVWFSALAGIGLAG